MTWRTVAFTSSVRREQRKIAAAVAICVLGLLVPRAAVAQAGAEPPSAAAIKTILQKASTGHQPTAAEANAVDRFAHAAAGGDVSASDFAEAFSPLLSSAPADVRAIINRARQGGMVGPAQVWRVAGVAAAIGQGRRVASSGASASSGSGAGATGAASPEAAVDHDPSRLELIAKVLHTEVCPGPAPAGAAALLGAAPPAGVALTTLLERIAKAALQQEATPAQPHLAQVFAASTLRDAPGLGAALWLHGSSNAAVYVFAEVARWAPNATTLTDLGAALNSVGAYGQAFQVLGAALRLDAKSFAARNNLAVARANLGDLRGAESDLRAVIAQVPQSTGARFGLGRVIECEGDVPRALPILQAAVATEPGSREAEFVDVLANRSDDAWDRARTGAYADDPGPPGAIFGSDRAVSSLGNGALVRPELPSGDAEWIATYEPSGGALRATMAQFAAQTAHYQDVEHALEKLENQAEKSVWTQPHGGAVILISDQSTLHALDFVERRASERAAKASSAFLDGMKRLDTLFKNAAARFEANPRVPPCSIFGPASDEEYQTFAGLFRTEYTLVNAASMDYAAAVRRLVPRLHDPYRAAREEASALETITGFNSAIYQDVLAFAPYVAQSAYGHCLANGTAKPGTPPPKDDKEPKPGPCATYFDKDLVIVKMKATCHTLELSGGEGVLAELKLDTQTHSGTVFLGMGLSASAPNSSADLAGKVYDAGPIGEVIGKAAGGPVGGSVGFDGSVGIVVTVDGSGDVTDAGFRFGAKYEAGDRSVDLTTTITVQNGMQFSPGFHSLEWMLGK